MIVMHTLILSKQPAGFSGWSVSTKWSTVSCHTIQIQSHLGTAIKHFSECHLWAQVIYLTPGVGRVILAIDDQHFDSQTGLPAGDKFRVEIASDADWALALLTY